MISSRHQKRILTLVFSIVLLLRNISIVIEGHKSDVHFVVQSGGDKLFISAFLSSASKTSRSIGLLSTMTMRR